MELQCIMFPGGMATGGPAAALPGTGAAQNFELQLGQLAEMGFHDRAACLRALQGAGGDVELALASLAG